MDDSDIDTKAREFISKNTSMLDEKKYYEFAQKVKLFGHRKFQAKKYDQAAAIFKAGANALYSLEEVEKNVPLELLDQLVDIYTADPKNLNKKTQQQLLAILRKRPLTQRQLKLIHTLIIKTGKPSQHEILAQALLNFNIEHNNFSSVERIASNLNSETSWNFVQKWSDSKDIFQEQIPALWCRMVLYRGIEHGINDAQEFFKNVSEICSNNNPFLIYTGFLLKTVVINSKNAYQTLERTYSNFLQNDPVFSSLTDTYGSKFFGIEKKKGGLLSLIQ